MKRKLNLFLVLIAALLTLQFAFTVSAEETTDSGNWVQGTISIPADNNTRSFAETGDINGDGVNLRATPSITGTILEAMYDGEIVYIDYSKSGTWYQGYRWLYVKRAKTGTIGYVYSKYVYLWN